MTGQSFRIPLRLWLWSLVAIVAAVLLWLTLRPVPQQVELGTVDLGDVTIYVRDRGIARVRDVFEVSAPVGGRLQRVEVEVGDLVEAKRTVLARLLPADPGFLDSRLEDAARARAAETDARAAAAKAMVRRAEAVARAARLDHDRVKILAREGWAAPAALERAQASRDEAEASVAAARAESVAAERIQLEARAAFTAPLDSRTRKEISIRAPVSGRVLAVHHQSEAVVGAGDHLVSIGDPAGDLEIVGEFLSSDAVRVSAGAPAIIEQWGGPVPLRAKVRRVEPTGFLKVSALGIEEQRVLVWADIEEPLERWKQLGHGYRVEMKVETDRARDAVRVPVPALIRMDGQWAVLVAETGRARLRRLRIDRMNETHAEVLEGLKPGDAVILFPPEGLIDGARIQS